MIAEPEVARGLQGASQGEGATRKRAPRVLIIIQNLPLSLDRRVRRECEALLAAGYGVSVICPSGANEPSFEVRRGVHVHQYRPPPPTRGLRSYLFEFVYCWVAAARLAIRIYRDEGFDAIQACNPPDTYFALALPFKALGRPFVYDQHDLCPEIYVCRFGRRAPILLTGLRTLEWATYRVADHVISTNESYRKIALGRGDRAPESVTVVRNGPDPAVMRRRPIRPELKRGRRFLACYLGVMGPQDGLDVLLQAIKNYVYELGRRDCQFVLIGYGDCYQDLRAAATAFGLGDWVMFTGAIIDDDTLASYLSTADVGLSPDPKNAFNDVSTMNKTMEYMAFGIPVVAFDLAETKVSAAEAAIYVAPNDPMAYARAIARLLDRADERTAMGTFGRRRVEQVLAWEYHAAAYVRIYDQLLRDRTPPKPLDAPSLGSPSPTTLKSTNTRTAGAYAGKRKQ